MEIEYLKTQKEILIDNLTNSMQEFIDNTGVIPSVVLYGNETIKYNDNSGVAKASEVICNVKIEI